MNEEQAIREHELNEELKAAGKTRPRYAYDPDRQRDQERNK